MASNQAYVLCYCPPEKKKCVCVGECVHSRTISSTEGQHLKDRNPKTQDLDEKHQFLCYETIPRLLCPPVCVCVQESMTTFICT